MPSVCDFSISAINDPSKLGDVGAVATSIPLGSPERGYLAASYSVPNGSKLTLRGVAVAALSRYSPSGGTAPGTVSGGAEIALRIAGTDAFRFRRQSWPVVAAVPGGDECVVPNYSAFQLLDFGDGVVVTSVQALTVTLSPAVNTFGTLYTASVWGSLGATVTCQSGSLVPNDLTSNQNIINYTPPSDFTIYGWSVDCVEAGNLICMGGSLRINGMVLHEFGPMWFGQESPSFMGTDNAYSPGSLYFPLEEMELNQGDRLELYIHAPANLGQRIGMQISGSLDSYSIGGGIGGGRSFTSVPAGSSRRR